jgi:hypothetical protein
MNGIGYCVQVTSIAATPQFTDLCFATSTNSNYSNITRIYNQGWTNTDVNTDIWAAFSSPGVYKNIGWSSAAHDISNNQYWTNYNLVTNAFSTSLGPGNRMGVWIDTDCNGTKNGLTSGAELIVPYCFNNAGAERTVYVGIDADNKFEFSVNGFVIESEQDLDVKNFRIFHIFPVTIKTGANIFNFSFIGDGTENDSAAFAIYDNTKEEIAAATQDSDLNILYSSAQLKTGSIDTYTCPAGYDFDCVSNTCQITTKTVVPVVNTGELKYTKRKRTCDNFTEDNIEGSGIGTYIPNETSSLCPVL